MGDLALPEEFIIIGAAIEPTPTGVRLKHRVTNDDIKRYMRVKKFDVIYDSEPKDFEFYKQDGSDWVMIKQPPLHPQLVSILIDKSPLI